MIYTFYFRFHRPRTNSTITFEVKATYRAEALSNAKYLLGSTWINVEMK